MRLKRVPENSPHQGPLITRYSGYTNQRQLHEQDALLNPTRRNRLNRQQTTSLRRV